MRSHDDGRRDSQDPLSQDDESDDSMSWSSDNEEEKNKKGFLNNTKKKFKRMKLNAFDTHQIVKSSFGRETANLCSACREIPFDECLPTDLAEEGTLPGRAAQTHEPIEIYRSLSTILKCRVFCKLCELLFKSTCQPEYDLLKAEHIRLHLPDSANLKSMESFAEWIKNNPYWKREWIGGVGLWPFGYAIDRQQAAESTLLQAKKLFSEAEDRDINTNSLNQVKDLYQTQDVTADMLDITQKGIALINLVAPMNQELHKAMAGAHFMTGQLALLQSKKRKRLPCIFMMKAYQRSEKKSGALSVRVYGHGRAPLATLKEICHFSLRFETAGDPRLKREQLWYGRKLEPRIDLPFFRHCIDTCEKRHDDCRKFLSEPASTPAWYEDAKFPIRVVDVHKMCVIEKSFQKNVVRPNTADDALRYVALSYKWGKQEDGATPEEWKQFKNRDPKAKPAERFTTSIREHDKLHGFV